VVVTNWHGGGAFVAQQGYVAVDFYDGSILYDFQQRRTMICDIDYYQQRPYTATPWVACGAPRASCPRKSSCWTPRLTK
jgi:hypothetical protein